MQPHKSRYYLNANIDEKGKSGVLQNKESRKAFLSDKNHRIRFVFTPKHCSWLNRIESWFGGLGRRVLNRGSFVSVDELNAKILAYLQPLDEDYIDAYNAEKKGGKSAVESDGKGENTVEGEKLPPTVSPSSSMACNVIHYKQKTYSGRYGTHYIAVFTGKN